VRILRAYASARQAHRLGVVIFGYSRRRIPALSRIRADQAENAPVAGRQRCRRVGSIDPMRMTFREPLAIEAYGLVKAFGAIRAVDRLDLSVPSGGVFTLLGPNGAGKTTTIRILTTLTRPDAGVVRVLGHDVTTVPHAVRSRICLTGQFATVDPSLTGTENLVLYARLLGIGRRAARSRAVELLDAFGLAEAAGRPVRTYSGGMQRRLDIAGSLVTAPALLFLDEPTTGLDPHSRSQVWEAIRWLAAQGTTVLLTTQYLDEADRLSDRIALIDHGRVVAAGTPGELKSLGGPSRTAIGCSRLRPHPVAPDWADHFQAGKGRARPGNMG
jgi:ABC-2 type transport system ATP-binding protein